MILEFLKSHFMLFVIIVIAAIIFYLAFFLTSQSIKSMKVSIFSAYPFDLFYPSERSWSSGIFIAIIIVLGIFIYLLAKSGIYLGGPA